MNDDKRSAHATAICLLLIEGCFGASLSVSVIGVEQGSKSGRVMTVKSDFAGVV